MFPFARRSENNDEYESLNGRVEKQSIYKKHSKSITILMIAVLSIALLLFIFSNTSSSQTNHSVNQATVNGNTKLNDKSEFTVKARAEFNGFGVTGYVEISEGGFVNIDVNLSDIEINSMNTICGENNLEYMYHIHNEWNHDDLDTKWGPTLCGSEYTAGHYNPFGVETCSVLANNEQISYFNCEIGDLSGRFGAGIPDIKDLILRGGAVRGGGGNRLMPEAVYRKSVVFHCSNGVRLFCAPFTISIE